MFQVNHPPDPASSSILQEADVFSFSQTPYVQQQLLVSRRYYVSDSRFAAARAHVMLRAGKKGARQQQCRKCVCRQVRESIGVPSVVAA